MQEPVTVHTLHDQVCACCEHNRADVLLRIEFSDKIDVAPWCMDCATDVVSLGLGSVVDA